MKESLVWYIQVELQREENQARGDIFSLAEEIFLDASKSEGVIVAMLSYHVSAGTMYHPSEVDHSRESVGTTVRRHAMCRILKSPPGIINQSLRRPAARPESTVIPRVQSMLPAPSISRFHMLFHDETMHPL